MKVLIPHPFVSAGLSLAGGGYRLSAFRGGVGIELENRSFFAIATAAYDNDRMTNDASQPNPKGDDRYLAGGVYFRSPWQLPRGTFLVGAGWQWNQLPTTNYTKTANRPQLGAAYDLFHLFRLHCSHDFSSLRIAMNWIMTGDDWQNGTHGPEIVLSFPSPHGKRHLFLEGCTGIYRSHETVTEPTNLPLARAQRTLAHSGAPLILGLYIASEVHRMHAALRGRSSYLNARKYPAAFRMFVPLQNGKELCNDTHAWHLRGF